MGHIELAAPVVHIWYLRGTRSWLAYLLAGIEPREELKAKQLEKVIYFAANLVTWVDDEQAPRRAAQPRGRAARGAATRSARSTELAIDRRFKELEDEVAGLEAEGAKDTEVKARQQAGRAGRRRHPRAATEAELELVQRAFDEFRDLHARKIIDDELLWRELRDRYGDYFEGGMGADAIKQLIDRIDFDEEEVKLRERHRPGRGPQARCRPSASRRPSSA